MMKKKVLAIDLVLAVGTIAILAFAFYLFNLQEVQFSPQGDLQKSKVFFRFEGERLEVCEDKIDCGNPREYGLFDGSKISLNKGEYYFRIHRENYIDVRPVGLALGVVFEIRELSDGSFGIVNVGEGSLIVDVQDSESLILETLGGENE